MYFLAVFVKFLLKFSDFINCDVSEKSHQNVSDYIHVLSKKSFEIDRTGFILSEKIGNSCNYIYDCAHFFFGEDFYPIC